MVTVSGGSPAIITETLYHLTQVRNVPISEIHVLTTSVGKKTLWDKLLNPTGEAHFHKLCAEYGLRGIKFDEETIHVLEGVDGTPLADIRTDEDNQHAAARVAELVSRLASDPDVVLHCSVAGGRKTMTIFMAFAFQLYARPGDTLSHVLVSPELENSPDFYFIPKKEKGVEFRTRVGTFSAKDARIQVADVPVVRLREKLPRIFENRRLSWADMVHETQQEMEATSIYLHVDTDRNRLVFGKTILELKPRWMDIFLFYVNLKKKHCKEPERRGHCGDCTACYEPLSELRYMGVNQADDIIALRTRNWSQEKKERSNIVLTLTERRDKLAELGESAESALSKLRSAIAATEDARFTEHCDIRRSEERAGHDVTRGIRIDENRIQFV